MEARLSAAECEGLLLFSQEKKNDLGFSGSPLHIPRGSLV
jgi:hypothetical protein